MTLNLTRRRMSMAVVVVTLTLLLSAQADSAPEPTSAWADVRAYGALGDGVKDDTPAFKRALESGLPVLIPHSKAPFLIKETLIVSSGQTVTGVGRGQSVVKCAANGACFSSDPQATKKTRDITLRDFTILGTENSAAIGIALIRTTDPTIENMLIRNIGGIGILIDGTKQGAVSQAHYAYIANVHIVGTNRIGVQFHGPKVDEGSNRHRVVFLRVSGSSEVGLDIGPQSSTSNYFGFTAENVHTAVRIAGRHNYFYGLQIEKAAGHGVEFLKRSGNNRFLGTTMSKVGGKRWANVEFNVDRGEAAAKDPEFAK